MTNTETTSSPSVQLASPDEPVYAHSVEYRIPVSDHLGHMQPIPASRMFILKNSVNAFKANHPGAPTFDASQGDGGASLPGVPAELIQRAAELQIKQGTAYIMPVGTEGFRKAVIEKYWKINPGLGLGPQNVVAAAGGRDALNKAYEASQALGYGRQGDVIITSRVPWLCYNWSPYMLGMNVLYAPGHEDQGWQYTPESIRETVKFAEKSGRKAAAIIITSPDNPTGLTSSPERQAMLAKAALQAGVAYVIFDWMYHYVTDEQPMDLNTFLPLFTPEERRRVMILDGITKSLGGSNIRNGHLIADEKIIQFSAARMSHMAVPTFFSQAVAQAAYEMGYDKASRSIVEPTNASRVLIKDFLEEHGFRHIIGKGYYTFINVRKWMDRKGWTDSEDLAAYLGTNFGLAVVPGAHFSPYGRDWIRFSYANPPEYTLQSAQRFVEGLDSLA
jgi:aspartate aminotransferase